MHTHIIGTGSYLPEHIVPNEFLTTIVDTDDEWIQSRTGIKTRHIVNEAETTVSMSAAAGAAALADSGLSAMDLDLILIATVTPDTIVPNTACLVQNILGAKNAAAIDLNAACTGFIFSLNTANAYLTSGFYKTALVIGVETLSKVTNWEDRSTCVLFGDGAGAVVLSADSALDNIAPTMITGLQGSDGSRGEVLYCKQRSNNNPFVQTDQTLDSIYMNGQEVYKFAIKTVPDCIETLLRSANKTLDEITYFLLHQANARIIQSVAKKLEIPLSKFPMNVDTCGNTSSATIPILLDCMNKHGDLHPGEFIVLAGFGGGLSWGGILIKW
ncbi:MAG: beta-ketoacyl-ACP synthase III [Lachnospiraceae bacterium]